MPKKNDLIRVFVLLALLCLTCLPCAAEETPVLYCGYDGEAAAGMTFRFFRVAESGTDGSLYPIGMYAYCPVRYDGKSASDRHGLAVTLAGYVIQAQVRPDAVGVSDENGSVFVPDLQAGVYLVIPTYTETEHMIFGADAFLLSVTGTVQTAEVKCVRYDADAWTDYGGSVTVIWEGNPPNPPGEVDTELYWGDSRYRRLTIDRSGGWYSRWGNVDGFFDWYLTTETVPGYTVEIRRSGTDFFVIYTPISTPPDTPGTLPYTPPTRRHRDDTSTKKPSQTGEELPRTGVVRWPIPMLAMGGCLLLVTGTIIGRKGRDGNA